MNIVSARGWIYVSRIQRRSEVSSPSMTLQLHDYTYVLVCNLTLIIFRIEYIL